MTGANWWHVYLCNNVKLTAISAEASALAIPLKVGDVHTFIRFQLLLIRLFFPQRLGEAKSHCLLH